jgi:hypothetical protein
MRLSRHHKSVLAQFIEEPTHGLGRNMKEVEPSFLLRSYDIDDLDRGANSTAQEKHNALGPAPRSSPEMCQGDVNLIVLEFDQAHRLVRSQAFHIWESM